MIWSDGGGGGGGGGGERGGMADLQGVDRYCIIILGWQTG